MRLRQIRKTRGLTRYALAKRAGISPGYVTKLEVGRSDPTIGMVVGSYEVWTLDAQTQQLRRNEEIPVVTHDEWTADNGRNNMLRSNGAGAPRSAPYGVRTRMMGSGSFTSFGV